jgi:hypothetical protein
VDNIYKVPLKLYDEGLDQKVAIMLKLPAKNPDLAAWHALVQRLDHPQGEVTIGICGKYVDLKEAYKSLHEALVHGGVANNVKVNLRYINSEEIDSKSVAGLLKDCDGVLVPGGFGSRGVEGKIKAIEYARRNGVPFFGICLGMQCAVIEFARNVAGLEGANSEEFDQETPHPVIYLMKEWYDFQKGRMECATRCATRAAPCAWAPTPAASCPAPGPTRPTPRTPSTSATATATNSTRPISSSSRTRGWFSRACRPTANWWKSWSCRVIRGSWAASSTPSSSPTPCGPTRCSASSSARRGSAGSARQGQEGLSHGPHRPGTARPGPGRALRHRRTLRPGKPRGGPTVGWRLAEVGEALGLPVIFKSSFDKANRTSVESFRARAWSGAWPCWPKSRPKPACPC